MNKMTQAALAALVLGACSASVFADDAAKGGDNNNDRWKGCTELGCSKDIPIKLTVKKTCTISDPKDLVLKTDATNVTSSYSVTTNTHYILNLSTANANTSNNTFVKNGSDKIDTVITTARTSGSAGPAAPGWGNNNYAGMSVDNFTVTARTKAVVPATAASGDYTDTYKIRVYY